MTQQKNEMNDLFAETARTDIVAVTNYRAGKDTLHLPTCRFARGTDSVWQNRPDHRVYRVCQSCMKGKTVFSLYVSTLALTGR